MSTELRLPILSVTMAVRKLDVLVSQSMSLAKEERMEIFEATQKIYEAINNLDNERYKIERLCWDLANAVSKTGLSITEHQNL